MGGGSYSPDAWVDYAARTGVKSKSVDAIYARSLHDGLDPKQIKNGIREACDGPDHPITTPVILGLDVTGSMASVLDVMAKDGMNTLVTELYARKPVPDPALMCMGIGDAEAGDRAPLQVTQFEADIRIQEQLNSLYLERGGGGNQYESYLLAHYFASRHTKSDAWDKRQKKGYLFTFGDEGPTPYLRKTDIERVLGDVIEADLTWEAILTEVSRKWEVFHLMVEEGSHFRSFGTDVRSAWSKVLGQRAIPLPDHTKLAEVVVSTIQINEGTDAKAVIDSWDGKTAAVVRVATAGLSKSGSDAGVVTL